MSVEQEPSDSLEEEGRQGLLAVISAGNGAIRGIFKDVECEWELWNARIGHLDW